MSASVPEPPHTSPRLDLFACERVDLNVGTRSEKSTENCRDCNRGTPVYR